MNEINDANKSTTSFVDRRKPGLSSRIRKYFEENPEEELTFKDIQAKFGCNRWIAYKMVYALREIGLLESVQVIRKREKGIASEQTNRKDSSESVL